MFRILLEARDYGPALLFIFVISLRHITFFLTPVCFDDPSFCSLPVTSGVVHAKPGKLSAHQIPDFPSAAVIPSKVDQGNSINNIYIYIYRISKKPSQRVGLSFEGLLVGSQPKYSNCLLWGDSCNPTKTKLTMFRIL